MSRASKTKTHWQPSCSLDLLIERAMLYSEIRTFFSERAVLEVETPLLSQHGATDLHIENFRSDYEVDNKRQTYFLQTSPEYAMKRLLAAGCGSIYQICKAFRQGESGRQHNPEFTMLEWYRIGFNHHQLMDEIDTFLQKILLTEAGTRISYRECFLQYLDIDPQTAPLAQLQNAILEKAIMADADVMELSHDTCLQLLLSHEIEPHLGLAAPLFLYDFPASQAALAKCREGNPPIAERFEVFYRGKEIANGFHELTDVTEQHARFLDDQIKRRHLKLSVPAIDENLLAALEHGLPDCAGVAMGLDRILMLRADKAAIDEVLAFAWERA